MFKNEQMPYTDVGFMGVDWRGEFVVMPSTFWLMGAMKACNGGSGRCGPVGYALACLVAICTSKSMVFRHTNAPLLTCPARPYLHKEK